MRAAMNVILYLLPTGFITRRRQRRRERPVTGQQRSSALPLELAGPRQETEI